MAKGPREESLDPFPQRGGFSRIGNGWIAVASGRSAQRCGTFKPGGAAGFSAPPARGLGR